MRPSTQELLRWNRSAQPAATASMCARRAGARACSGWVGWHKGSSNCALSAVSRCRSSAWLVRLATRDDGDACALIYAPYVTDTAISFEVVPPDGTEMAGRIARTMERTPWVVVEVDGVEDVLVMAGGPRHADEALSVHRQVGEGPAEHRRQGERAGVERVDVALGGVEDVSLHPAGLSLIHISEPTRPY